MRSAKSAGWNAVVAVCAVFAAMTAGCQMGPSGAAGPGAATGAGGKADSPGNVGGDAATQPALQYCTAGTMPTHLATTSWNHWETNLYAIGGAHHSARDVLATEAAGIDITGEFTYGPERKELEDENVEVWIDDCGSGYRMLGDARTDGEGQLSYKVPDGAIPAPGIYDVYLRVEGDGSGVATTLSVFPSGTHLVVFDIDGTLTASNTELYKNIASELFEPLGSGEYVPKARADAPEVTWARAQQGYPVVYLTGRPDWLDGVTREWLDSLGFASGTVMLAPTLGDVLPTNSGVGDYKANYLDQLTAMGFVIDDGYGNATTDIYAYNAAGLAKDHTYIVGPNGGQSGTVNLGDGFTDHVAQISSEPPVDQPFTW